jgi:hypothetical protein
VADFEVLAFPEGVEENHETLLAENQNKNFLNTKEES